MLYDILNLPCRLAPFAELETVVPIFDNNFEMENVFTYGRIFQPPDVIKYKTIELVEDTTIERIFTTDEEIDFRKSWWKSDMDIFPLSFKIYNHRWFQSQSFRYVDGMERLLARGNWNGRSKPIHLEELDIAKRVLRGQKQYDEATKLNRLRKNIRHPIHKLFVDDDSTNIRELESLRRYDYHGFQNNDIYEQYRDIYCGAWMPDLNIQDAITQISTKEEPILSEIAKMRSVGFGVNTSSVLMQNFEEPFDTENPGVMYYEENEETRSLFHLMIQFLERSPYTDISIDLIIIGGKVRSKKAELYSRYFGITDYKRVDPAYEQTLRNLEHYVWHWSMVLLFIPGEYKVSLQKNWLEEVFIELTIGKTVRRYYIDLVMYGLGSLSLLEFE